MPPLSYSSKIYIPTQKQNIDKGDQENPSWWPRWRRVSVATGIGSRLPDGWRFGRAAETRSSLGYRLRGKRDERKGGSGSAVANGSAAASCRWQGQGVFRLRQRWPCLTESMVSLRRDEETSGL
ncbi:hypothetical protein LR48_Vigan08g191400 [Vigna angularis]|uniref:Uncharacterized protein n=1 Tax=Phaseolus angularis TaxID=3914 RepID=A0A0L9V7P8_PHAAN|nr:hypothetical protein LR48_Vigan08g191300 [Vigna angularis]KOM51087.1 hypothetical protein LR48_Vigan08g191400 [Vigna angularis]